MSQLDLTVACDFTDRTKTLFAGLIEPDGIDLNMLPVEIEEVAKRMAWHQEFDAAEMSMSNYILALSKGREDMIAIPVFPSRFFRHSCIWVNSDAGIDEPADLRGKKVGIPTYPMTAALWLRGILAEEYDVHPEELDWYYGGEEDSGRKTTIVFSVPDEVDLSPIGPGETLSQLLEERELDALFAARTPSTMDTRKVELLFENYKEVEMEYFQRTNFFPIMHTIVLDRDVYRENRWIARELLDAFTEAKDYGLNELGSTVELKASVPWLPKAVQETRELMGKDYWPYGVEPNRETLEKMTEYSYDQGLSERKVGVDELFAEPTYHDPTKI